MNKNNIISSFKDIQEHICVGITKITKQNYHEDNWKYSENNTNKIFTNTKKF